jgi:hypothetical protein
LRILDKDFSEENINATMNLVETGKFIEMLIYELDKTDSEGT